MIDGSEPRSSIDSQDRTYCKKNGTAGSILLLSLEDNCIFYCYHIERSSKDMVYTRKYVQEDLKDRL